MRQLSDKYRLNGFALQEIREAVEHSAVHYGQVYTLNGNKLRPGPMMTAILLNWLRRPEVEREAVVREGLKELERLMALDEPERMGSGSMGATAGGKAKLPAGSNGVGGKHRRG